MQGKAGIPGLQGSSDDIGEPGKSHTSKSSVQRWYTSNEKL